MCCWEIPANCRAPPGQLGISACSEKSKTASPGRSPIGHRVQTAPLKMDTFPRASCGSGWRGRAINDLTEPTGNLKDLSVTYGAPSDPLANARVDVVLWNPGGRPGGDTDQVGRTATWWSKLE